jgi:hypothetical protein
VIRTVLLAAFLSLTLSSCATTQKGALSRAQGAYDDGEFEKCLSHVTRAESYGEHSELTNARLSFQRALCLEGAGRKAEAIEVYRNLMQKHPDSDWAAQARARSGA